MKISHAGFDIAHSFPTLVIFSSSMGIKMDYMNSQLLIPTRNKHLLIFLQVFISEIQIMVLCFEEFPFSLQVKISKKTPN